MRSPRRAGDVPIGCPALVSWDTFMAAAATRDSRRPRATPPRVANGVTMLPSRIARCGEPGCGAGLTVRSGKGGRDRYYPCEHRENRAAGACSPPLARPGPRRRRRSATCSVLSRTGPCRPTAARWSSASRSACPPAGRRDRDREHRAPADNLAKADHAAGCRRVRAGGARQVIAGDPNFRRSCVALLVEQVTVSAEQIRRSATRPAPEHLLVSDRPPLAGTVPGFDREWCGREDSNFHGLSPTTTSTLRVYQFRHGRT